LDIKFDVESFGSWDGNNFFSAAVPTTGDILFNGPIGRNFGQLLSVSLELDPSIDTVEVVWTNTNSGRDEVFGIDNIQVTGGVVPEPSILLGLGTLTLSTVMVLNKVQPRKAEPFTGKSFL